MSDKQADISPDDCLEEKMEAISRFSSRLSHKINNPLTYVYNYLFILKSTLTDEKNLSIIRKMEEGLNRTKNLLYDLVEMSDGSSGVREQVDIKAIVLEAVGAHSQELKEKAITVNKSFAGSTAVSATRENILKVITHLLDNSIEAGATVIDIESKETEKGNIEITVADNGSGIEENNLKFAFEPFFTTKNKLSGTGLYSVFHLARSYGGSVSCSRLKQGMKFQIRLPGDLSA
jgi:signal transduction histidine kinase